MKAKVKYGSNASIPIDFEGPLVLIPDEIEAWLEKILHSEVSREQFQRKTKTVFPIAFIANVKKINLNNS